MSARPLLSIQDYEHVSICSSTKHITGVNLYLIWHNWKTKENKEKTSTSSQSQYGHFTKKNLFFLHKVKHKSFSAKLFAVFIQTVHVFFTHMACRTLFVNQQDIVPSQSPHHPLLYPANDHMETGVSDLGRGRQSQPSPKTNLQNPLWEG